MYKKILYSNGKSKSTAIREQSTQFLNCFLNQKSHGDKLSLKLTIFWLVQVQRRRLDVEIGYT